MEWMLLPYRRLYKLIEGRAPRREYWMFTLLLGIVLVATVVLITSVAGAVGGALKPNPGNPAGFGGARELGELMGGLGEGAVIVFLVFYIWILLTAVASIAVTVRRLHDHNLSGWFFALIHVVLFGCALISMSLYWAAFVGSFVVMCLPGTKGPNKYGSDPTDSTAGAGAEVFA